MGNSNMPAFDPDDLRVKNPELDTAISMIQNIRGISSATAIALACIFTFTQNGLAETLRDTVGFLLSAQTDAAELEDDGTPDDSSVIERP